VGVGERLETLVRLIPNGLTTEERRNGVLGSRTVPRSDMQRAGSVSSGQKPKISPLAG